MPTDMEELMSPPYTEREETVVKMVREPAIARVLELVGEHDPTIPTDFDFEDEAFLEHMVSQISESETMADAIRIVVGQVGVARESRQKALDQGRAGVALGWDTKGRQLVQDELDSRGNGNGNDD